jgi:DNA-directed RNA polymerase subunit RPC12/RpoP
MMDFADDKSGLPLSLPDELKAEILAQLQGVTPTEVVRERRLLACPQCRTLYQHLYVCVRHNQTTLYETRYPQCKVCQSKLVPADEDATQYRCAHCGQQALEDGGAIMWD